MAQNAERSRARGANQSPRNDSTNVAQPPTVVNDPFTLAIRAAVSAAVAPVMDLLEGLGHTTPKFLTNEELCAALQISQPTLRKLVDDGMPHLLLGEVRRFSISAVEQYLSERAKAGAT